MAALSGKLTLTLHQARGLYCSQLMANWQSCFAVFNIDPIPHKTKVHYKGGIAPVWECTQVFALDGMYLDFLVEVFHQAPILNDFIGRAKIPVADLIVQKEQKMWYRLSRGTKEKPLPAGEILIGVQWLPSSGPATGATSGVPQAMQASQIQLPGRNVERVSIGSYYHLMALAKNGNYYIWNGNTGTWHPQPGNAALISAGSDGSMWVQTADGLLFRYDLSSHSWQSVEGPARITVTKIAVGNSENVAVMSNEGNVYRWEPAVPQPKSDSDKKETDTPDEEDKVAVVVDNKPKWKQVQGIDGVIDVDIDADGELWAVLSGKTVSRFDPDTQSWANVPSPAVTHVSVGNGFQIVATNSDTCRVHKLDTTTGSWSEMKNVITKCCDIGSDGVYLACNADEIYFGRF